MMTKDFEKIRKACFWKANPDWFVVDDHAYGGIRLTDLAPREAIESFELWISMLP